MCRFLKDKDKPLEDKSLLVEEAYYAEAIDILESLPRSTHLVWKDLPGNLDRTTSAQRSKSVLYRELEKACEIEEFDWKGLDFIKMVCQYRPEVIQHKGAANILYRLMGVPDYERARLSAHQHYICCKALWQDEELADAISLFLNLLAFIQDKHPRGLNSTLQRKWQKVEKLLEKNRVAPKIRHFMDLWDKTIGNWSEDDCDEIGEEDESPSRKRRCIKAEE